MWIWDVQIMKTILSYCNGSSRNDHMQFSFSKMDYLLHWGVQSPYMFEVLKYVAKSAIETMHLCNQM